MGPADADLTPRPRSIGQKAALLFAALGAGPRVRLRAEGAARGRHCGAGRRRRVAGPLCQPALRPVARLDLPERAQAAGWSHSGVHARGRQPPSVLGASLARRSEEHTSELQSLPTISYAV